MALAQANDVHPSTVDPRYRARRAALAALATGPDEVPADITYTEAEHGVWQAVLEALEPEWDRAAASPLLAARNRLGLPTDRVPQLREVTEALAPLTGFDYRAVPGLVPTRDFFGALAGGRFLSTQYVRHEEQPLYTPEPDVIHEVVGHAHLLADPRLAELHRLAGAAVARARHDQTVQFIADVFWFSAEFGVVREGSAWKAYGAGLLSSHGELGWFADSAEIRPLDIVAMGTLPYDITHYQPVLFGGESLDQVLEVVGGFFRHVDDATVRALLV